MIIENIHGPQDVKELPQEELPMLAQEIRSALLTRGSVHGGHFGPNFGFVEATIALHRVFNSPVDKIVYDVSHQSYPHKMLTGRAQAYLDPDHYDDVSGYTNPAESEHDFFEVGHTSTSISLALGLAKARDLAGGKENIIAVIGDGSLSGGEALEGLDVAGELTSNFIIVFNDNQMSIAENHGGMYDEFTRLRESHGTDGHNVFRAMGLDYIYVEEGNTIDSLIEIFETVRDIDHPIVVHLNTKKGKGYGPAEADPEHWHWASPFNVVTGEQRSYSGESYGALMGDHLEKLAQFDKKLLVVSSAVPGMIGMNPERRQRMGIQYIDVGIAEETAAALISGAAKGGAHPVWASSATFIQRAYDQMFQDISINGNAATILAGNGSVFGGNDVTHCALSSIAMVSSIPGMKHLVPSNAEEYLAMVDWAIKQDEEPVYITIPTGPVVHASEDQRVRTDYSKLAWELVHEGSRVALIAVGDFFGIGQKTIEKIAGVGIDATLVKPLFASGLDTATLDALAQTHDVILTIEDGIADGGFGQRVSAYLGADTTTKVLVRGFERKFYDRFKPSDLLEEARITPEKLTEDVLAVLED